MHLTLLVPELIWPEPGDDHTLGKLELPGLESLLARGKITRKPRRPQEISLAALFNEPAPAPFGALRLLGEGDSEGRTGYWLCADPVHLRFHHERIVLADAGAFELDLNEAHDIVTALNCEFADVGHFHVGNARRWYLKLHQAIDHPVPPLSAVAGRRVDTSDRSALPLTRLINEIQMYLHGHPVNAARQQEGKPAINSLWLWGGGTLEPWAAEAAGDFTSIFADDAIASGIALARHIPGSASLAAFSDLPDAAGERPLVMLDALQAGVIYEDSRSWRNTLCELDHTWFRPLGNALGRQVDRITLIAPTIYGELQIEIHAGARWHFWKRPQALVTTAQSLAEVA